MMLRMSALPALDWTTALQWFPIIFSIVALLISAITLWKDYLSPFGLEIAHTNPCFSLYKITPDISGTEDGRTWWIPSFDAGFTFYNRGQKIGRVKDIRLTGVLRSGECSETVTFSAKWVVRYASFMPNRHDRMRWVYSSIERDWYPLILSAKETKHLHLIFEGEKWDDKRAGEMEYTLEILASDTDKWKECARYRQAVYEWMFESKDIYTSKLIELA